MNKEFFIVGQWLGNDRPWALIGLYDSEDAAVKACTEDVMFVGPAILNQTLPVEEIPWPGAYYPAYRNAGVKA